MKMRSRLFSGAAGLAIAVALSFGAQAQTYPAHGQDQTSPEMTGNMPSGEQPMWVKHKARHKHHVRGVEQDTMSGQTPATAPSVARSAQRHHRGVYAGQSGPQESTDAEAAATDRLNRQQLNAAWN